MKTSRRTKLLGTLAIAIAASGCGESLGPIDSIPMSLTINSMNASDIEPAGVIEKDENISTETGNPWGEFVKIAEDRCSASPTGFEVLSVTVALDVDGSSDVSGFEDVVSGEATVFFASTRGSDSAALRVDVASAAGLTGVGPVSLPVVASPAALDALFERMLGGDFHVGLNARTNRLETDSFSMDVRVTLQARARCG